MKILFVILVCLILILGSCAQKPHPCRAPPLLEGKLTVLVPGEKIRVYEKFYYDAIGQNVCVVAYGKEDNKTIFADRLLLFREGVKYDIHYHNQTCVKTALKEPFVPIEVPHDAHFLHQLVIGSSSRPGEGLLVNNWEGIVPQTKEHYFMSFTEFGCLPIYSIYFTEKMDVDIMTSFYDLVNGIEDPEVFIPPSFCDSVKPLEAKDDKVTNFFKALL
ncbi:ependymin [Triplophysa rosa]|uniref:Ependymin n=1 Tax=Triplophysa rosa TaxID=992332 RepID=A0A9W7THT6_TRIRA|nr:ependymin [Triplophysa rosa]KAI7796327.1 putative ependymin [Triplophysa rosa]